MDERVATTTDPQRIRALTHPLRLELLELLDDGPATATECAAGTGESVASCSFHLRMLAKYGWIEPAERRGREKPWALATRGRDIRPEADNPESMRALTSMAALWLEHEVEHVRHWLADAPREPEIWVQASTLYESKAWATAEEMAELSATVQRLTDRFDERRDDPTKRPPGSRPIRVLAAVHVDLAKERRGARGDA
jgi:DNA-binding transcriptional ArsR family regulator